MCSSPLIGVIVNISVVAFRALSQCNPSTPKIPSPKVCASYACTVIGRCMLDACLSRREEQEEETKDKEEQAAQPPAL